MTIQKEAIAGGQVGDSMKRSQSLANFDFSVADILHHSIFGLVFSSSEILIQI